MDWHGVRRDCRASGPTSVDRRVDQQPGLGPLGFASRTRPAGNCREAACARTCPLCRDPMDRNGLGRLAGSRLGLGGAGCYRCPGGVLGEWSFITRILCVIDRNGVDHCGGADPAIYGGDADYTGHLSDCSIDRSGFLQRTGLTERSAPDANPRRPITIVAPGGNAEMTTNADGYAPARRLR